MNVPLDRHSTTVKTLLLELVTLQNGDRGEEVEKLQVTLQALGYDCGTIDGQYGDRTQTAVANLQHHFGLEADGIFNPATWYAITFWANEGHFALLHWLGQLWKQLRQSIANGIFPHPPSLSLRKSKRRTCGNR